MLPDAGSTAGLTPAPHPPDPVTRSLSGSMTFDVSDLVLGPGQGRIGGGLGGVTSQL